MDTLHAGAATLLDWLLETSVQVVVLIALVALAQVALRRWLTPRWRYGLWLLVLARLMVPALPPSPFSVFNVSTAVRSEVAAAPGEDPVPTTFAPEPAAALHAARTAAPRPAAPAVAAPAAVAVATATTWPVATLLAGLWLGVALALALWAAVRQIVFTRRIRRHAVAVDGRPAQVLAECARAARVRHAPVLLRTDLVGGPALTGVLRPCLLAPGALLDRLGDGELRHVFRHELAHLRAGDVLLNWLLACVQAVHWFNPLVWFAFARLRATRESARDWTALAGETAAARRAYGETLIRLLEGNSRRTVRPGVVGILEGRHDMRRRITMIARFDRDSRAARAAGVLAVLVLGGIAFTGATIDDARGQEETPADPLRSAARPDAATAGFARTVHVERRVPAELARWRPALQAKLTKQLSVNFVETPLSEALAYLGQATGANIVVAAECLEDVGSDGVTLRAEDVRADQILRLLLRQVDLGYSLTAEVVYVNRPDALTDTIEQRFYDITDLVKPDAASRPADAPPDWEVEWEQLLTDQLVDLVGTVVAPGSWDREGRQIAVWKKLLVVHQSDAVHAEVERFLNLLLNAGKAPARPAPGWRREIETKLAERVSLHFEDTPLGDATAFLQTTSGVPVVVSDEDLRIEPISIKLEDVTRRKALEWLARMVHARVAFVDGAAVLTRSPPNEVAVYPVRDILDARRRPDADNNSEDELLELLMVSVDPVSWEDTATAQFWNGFLIVAQSEDVHPKIVEFLETLRRALR